MDMAFLPRIASEAARLMLLEGLHADAVTIEWVAIVVLWLIASVSVRRAARRFRVRHFRHMHRHSFVHAAGHVPERFSGARTWCGALGFLLVAAFVTAHAVLHVPAASLDEAPLSGVAAAGSTSSAERPAAHDAFEVAQVDCPGSNLRRTAVIQVVASDDDRRRLLEGRSWIEPGKMLVVTAGGGTHQDLRLWRFGFPVDLVVLGGDGRIQRIGADLVSMPPVFWSGPAIGVMNAGEVKRLVIFDGCFLRRIHP